MSKDEKRMRRGERVTVNRDGPAWPEHEHSTLRSAGRMCAVHGVSPMLSSSDLMDAGGGVQKRLGENGYCHA
jgi:hypothetical protein